MASSYDPSLFTSPPLPNPDQPRPMHNSPFPSYHLHQPKLSLFQQTLRDEEEAFYKTFPAARIAALLQDPQSQAWRPSYEKGSHLGLGGCGFLLERADASSYPYNPQGHFVHQMPIPSQSSLSRAMAMDPAPLVCQQREQVSENQYTSYVVRDIL